MDSQVMTLLNTQLQDREKSIVEALASGSAKDFAEYKNLVGVVHGLRTAQGYLKDLLKKLETYDDAS